MWCEKSDVKTGRGLDTYKMDTEGTISRQYLQLHANGDTTGRIAERLEPTRDKADHTKQTSGALFRVNGLADNKRGLNGACIAA